MATVPARRFRHAAREVAVALVIAARRGAGDRRLRARDRADPLRVLHPRAGLPRRLRPRLPARRGPARAGPPRRARGAGRRRPAGADAGVRRAAAPLRLARAGRPGCSTACTGAGTTSAPSRGRSRRCSASPPWPGAATCGPGAARAGGSAPSASPRRRRSPRPCWTRGSACSRAGSRWCTAPPSGLAIGFLLIRVDLRVTGPRGRRARRAEEAAAGRPEPARTRALL